MQQWDLYTMWFAVKYAQYVFNDNKEEWMSRYVQYSLLSVCNSVLRYSQTSSAFLYLFTK